MLSPSDPTAKVGYVLKVYPRFSETFVVTEILAREAAGEQLAVYALRPTTDARFHPQIAQVQAPVTHLPRAHRLPTEWEVFARAQEELPGFGPVLGELMPLLVRMDPSDVAQAVDLAVRVRRDGITHLHAHFATLAARAAMVASALSGIPYSVTTHAKDLFHEDVDPVLLRAVLRRAAHVVAISDYNRRFLLDLDPTLAGSVRLVRNGLALPRFTFADPVAPRTPLRVLAVGRLVEKKGFEHLVRAAAQLREAGMACSVRVVGDGEFGEPLAALVEELGLTGSVELVGPRSQAELVQELGWADVLAAPCVVGADGNADGLPTVILEAMASGLPCIATDVTGIPEAVHPAGVDADGEPVAQTGILLPHDVDGLADRLAGALREVADPSWPRVEVARAARAAVERDFDTVRQSRLLAELQGVGGGAGAAAGAAPTGAPPADLVLPSHDLAEVSR
ncbi:glycosyltransferase [Ornithinimicrobium pekingense]|uniref:Colanic acid biosynthesis glycosyltransferase WcaL n=1 Tax=Ornithinimicrobium pekingense TaxID=384677 RepID=A0ABQ2FBS7_9MICO|nr:glycosyltransferase [Ornithinimicrobium pekingense]GGK78890.1 colanic acid biosynthesis glycosyltransferase WcaL [Ornithinimicrobium pekingense]